MRDVPSGGNPIHHLMTSVSGLWNWNGPFDDGLSDSKSRQGLSELTYGAEVSKMAHPAGMVVEVDDPGGALVVEEGAPGRSHCRRRILDGARAHV